ncbi:peroxiredoxin [Coxiella endosymbiont of Amblyomma americanum]|uniref:peroxiredoxin n=1 Tax=Coxiella endosymbiont of Amblyomma americanum TaxID=325775 RepID=UPI00057CC06D|nr:peroxiredoxin [Coxiella endosymbiont of Amblyomma americanum]AJC50215.1 alkyl hydroperoxide reductase [Coxiella endosymbiont of Amblyomma americanum]AUJ58577.1 peroxiredoxin [Coxiella-like endosymbiont of Amblyomma americanum]
MEVLVGRKAPDFTVPAVLASGDIVEDFNLYKSIKNKYGLVFFYPLDFTFVCPSELIALHHAINDFYERNVEIVAISVDSQFAHYTWRSIPVEKGGIGSVSYTLASDVSHSVCRSYGVEYPQDGGIALRGVFLIDKQAIVRSQTVNDFPLGRSISEILRVIDALQFTEKNENIVCPANWKKGDVGIQASPEGVVKYLLATNAS